MKGLEIAESYYNTYGKSMIEGSFGDIADSLTIGLVGEGSECFGFDDKVSEDHDFEPCFCIFVSDDIDPKTEFQLERAYAKLPSEFEGFKKQKFSPVGGSRHGVIKTGDFYESFTGFRSEIPTLYDWINIPDSMLATATNGKIFYSGNTDFIKIRDSLIAMPEDVRLKKLAGRVIMMEQSGQYNYVRCLEHGETAAAQLAVNDFVMNTIGAVFLLNNKYMPFYKWTFRGLRSLDKMSELADILEYLLTTDNSPEIRQEKTDSIEAVAETVISELQSQKLTTSECNDLEKHAYNINDRISDSNLRNMHIMSAVK